MEKMTKKKMFTMIKEVVKENAEMVAFIDHEIELIDKKNGAVRKPTVTQKENEVLKVAILEGMEAGTLYTVGDLMKGVPALADLSNQRVSALVRQLKESGKVDRKEVKRKAYFSKVEG